MGVEEHWLKLIWNLPRTTILNDCSSGDAKMTSFQILIFSSDNHSTIWKASIRFKQKIESHHEFAPFFLAFTSDDLNWRIKWILNEIHKRNRNEDTGTLKETRTAYSFVSKKSNTFLSASSGWIPSLDLSTFSRELSAKPQNWSQMLDTMALAFI